jgi:hypothetical protein
MTNTIQLNQKEGSKLIPVYLPEEQFTYGDSNQPSTPVKLVIGNCYALKAEDHNHDMYQTRMSKYNANRKTVFKDVL